MSRYGKSVLLLVLVASGLSGYGLADNQESEKKLQEWRSQRVRELLAPDGWLAVVALDWLKTGKNTFGTSEQDYVQLPGKDHEHYGVLDVEQTHVWLRAPDGGFPANLRVDGHKASEQEVILDGKHATTFTAGSLKFFVIQRADKLALRVKDSQAAGRLNFRGLRWYAPDPRYRIEAQWVPYPELKAINIQNVVGLTTQGFAAGVAKLTIDGQEITLEPFVSDANAKSLMFVIRDATSGKTTYAASRFLHTGLPDHGLSAPGKLVLDFNRLENPPCAFTEFATCPLPPEGNRLHVALEAGEQRYDH
jgi:uncharacterized protein